MAKRTAIFLPNFLSKMIADLVDRMKAGQTRSIPWSLDGILNFDFEKAPHPGKKIMADILKRSIPGKEIGLVGISAIYPEQLFFGLMAARIIKEIWGEDIRVAMGGTQITKHISHIIRNKNASSFVDFFVTGDGEETLLRLSEALSGGRLSEIPNLYYRPAGAGDHRPTSSRFRLKPEDFPVPDFSGFDLGIYKKQLPILASKGCFWSRCNFCTYASMHEKAFSISSVDKVIENIRLMKKKYGVSSFRFVDDALPPRFMKDLAHGLLRDDLRVKWATSIVLTKDMADAAFCRLLRESGLHQVSIGLESVSPRVLNLMNKCHRNLDLQEITGILANLKAAGINIGLHILFGFPTETLDEARITLDFLTQNKDIYDLCMFQPFCLEDGTPVFDNYREFGITRIYEDDKDSGERLGYRYDVSSGMSQDEAARFSYSEALTALKKAGIAAKTQKSHKEE